MSQSAKVLSVQALKDFKISLIKFVEEGRNALSGVDMEIRRTRDWLERDQLSYWQSQVKRRHEAMMTARTELHRRQISQQGSDAVSDTEQKEALREAKQKLRVAEEKVEIVKRLIPVFDHAVAEYLSSAMPLGDHLSGGIEKSLGKLENMVVALEQYLSIAPPSTPRFEAPADSSGAADSPTAAATSAARGGDPREALHKAGTLTDPVPSPSPESPAENEHAPAPAAAHAAHGEDR